MKPHRSIFEAALADAGVDAAEALMVGDSLRPTSKARSPPGCERCGCAVPATSRRSGRLPCQSSGASTNCRSDRSGPSRPEGGGAAGRAGYTRFPMPDA